MRFARHVLGSCVLTLLAACAGEAPINTTAPPESAPAASGTGTLATFEGTFDGATSSLELSFRGDGEAPRAAAAGGLHTMTTLPEGSSASQVVAHTVPGSVHYESGTYASCTSGSAGDFARLCGNVQ